MEEHTFDAWLDWSSSDLGMEVGKVRCVPHALCIGKVTQGSVEIWNKSHPQRIIERCSRIVQVDHGSGNSQLLFDTLHSCKGRKSVHLKVQRPSICTY